MFLKFSEDAQKLLLLSLKEKNYLNDSYIGTEHVFLALLSMHKNYVCDLLNSLSINYDNFSSFFVKKKESNYSNYFLFTPLMKNIFNNLYSNLTKKNVEVGILDIVVEILNEASSKVVFVLRKMGIDIKDILKALNVCNKKKKGLRKGILSDLGVNLNERNTDEVLIGREKEIGEIIEILCCKNKNNPILIGEAGVGKTAIIEELAKKIEKGDVPLKLRGKKIFSIAMSSLVAGTKYRGEFEEKINKLIAEVEGNDDIILFIDEIHTLVGAGGADGAIDASNILKPSLARGNIKIIGATTKDEYNKYFSDDKALNRRFRIVLCEEPDLEKTRNILKGIKDVYEKYHSVVIDDNILNEIVYFADKFIKNKKFPDKAIDILDEVCVLSSLENNRDYEFINCLDKKNSEIIKLKNNALLMGDYKRAIDYSYEEKKIQFLISKHQKRIIKINRCNLVDRSTLLKIMEKKTNIPFYTYEYDNKSLDKIVNRFKKETIFKDDIANRICDYTIKLYSGLINKNTSNFIYLISKNENINNYFINNYIKTFFKKNNVIYLDINNYRNIDELLKYDDKNNLFNRVKLYPFSIFVISNYNDCDYSIKDFFEKVSKKGYYMDKNNNKVDFSNSLFIYSFLDKKNIGFIENCNSDCLNISNIDEKKLQKYIKNLGVKIGVSLTNSKAKKIALEILSSYDNLNNVDYLIRKESINDKKTFNKIRTIKI